MKAENVREMLLQISDNIIENEKYLCQLDSFIGDGDHGVTVAKGFRGVKEMLENETFETPGAIFVAVGKKLSTLMGGAIGPILGGFFSGGANKVKECEELEAKEFDILFADGLKRVKMLGDAKPGDRTLVDALEPAAAAFHEANMKGLLVAECMKAASEAAKAGAESTKDMVAKKGRAKFLGEKSKGYVDAGATSVSIIIETMADYLNT